MNRLIGEWQQLQAAGLVERLARLRRGENLPRAVVLEGESGSGKSRIVREVYSSLRAQQPGATQGYWPSLSQDVLVKEDGAPDLARLEKLRKVIGPSTKGFQRPPGTLPSYFWWSMNCGMSSDGSLVEIAAGLIPQLSAHLPYLAEQWRTGIQGDARLKRFLKQAPESAVRKAKDLKGDFTLETLGQVLTALELAAPGYGTALTEIWRGGEALWERRSRADDVRRGGPLRSGEEGAKEIVRQLTRFGSKQLPIVLVIEDLHLMSDGLAELLDLLVQPAAGFPVMILGTAVGFGANATWTRWRSAALEMGVAEVRKVPAMADAERSELTIQFGLGPEAADQLRKYQNPWTLILAMAHPKLGGRLRKGQPAALEGVPESVQDFYRTQWRTLEEPVREVLVVTAAITDSGHQEVLATGVASTASHAWNGERRRYDHALAQAVDPCAWLEDPSGSGRLLAFGDPYRYGVAHLNASDQFDDSEMAALGGQYAATITQWLVDNAGDGAAFTRPSVRAAARKFLEDQPGPADDPIIVRLAAGIIADAQAAVLDTAGAVETWDRYVDPTTINWEDVQDLRDMHTLAARAWASGDLARGIEMLDKVVTHRDALLGRRHEESMAAREDLAVWYSEVGEYRRALRIAEALLEDQTAYYGPRAEETLMTRWRLAQWYGDDYKYRKAIQIGEALLEDSKGIWRRDDRDLTLLLRSHIAYWYGNVDQREKSVELYAALLRDRQLFLGFDDEDTLNTRSNLAIQTGYAGDPEQAAAQLEALIPDLASVLGEDERQTLLAMHNAAFWHGEAGAHQRAIRLLHDVRRRQERQLGVDHEDVLRTRSNLARLYEDVGQRGRAIRAYEDLVQDCLRVLGSEDPQTWDAVENLAKLANDEGRLWMAFRLFERLAVARTEILEEDSHDVVSAKWQLAGVLCMMGDLQESIPLIEQAKLANERIFGPNSDEALGARRDLSVAHAMAGHLDRAITILEALSRDVERWFGADAAPNVKEELGTWLRVRKALDPATLRASLGRVPTAADFFRTATDEGSSWVSVAQLIAGCRAVGVPSMIEAVASQARWSHTPHAAWLELVDSGYDPWRVGHWWMIWASALKAALDAVEDEDPEDLRLILQLNPSLAANYGPALRLLAGAGKQTLVQDPAQTAEALDHIATWVIPETPLGERARLLAEN